MAVGAPSKSAKRSASLEKPSRVKAAAKKAPKAKKQAKPITVKAAHKEVSKPVVKAAEKPVVAAVKVQSVSASAREVAAKLRDVEATTIDISIPTAKRPLTGFDVEQFRTTHSLQIRDMVHVLELASAAQYKTLVQRITPLNFETEFVVRICDAYPTPPPWTTLTMQEAFDLLYGQTLRDFQENTPKLVDHARVVLFYRFTALFGRSSFSGYRWIQNAGSAKRILYLVLAKIFERQEPLATAENMARLIWGVRGIDFDKAFPMPTIANLATGPRRGRLPGAAARRSANLEAAERGLK